MLQPSHGALLASCPLSAGLLPGRTTCGWLLDACMLLLLLLLPLALLPNSSLPGSDCTVLPCTDAPSLASCSGSSTAAAAADVARHQGAAAGSFAMLGSHIMTPQLLQQLLHSPAAPGLPQPAVILPFYQPSNLPDLPDLPEPAPSEGVQRFHMHHTCTSHAPHMHLTCTTHAPHMHHTCTSHAPHMHHTCTTHAPHTHSQPHAPPWSRADNHGCLLSFHASSGCAMGTWCTRHQASAKAGRAAGQP
jgi:hypothetical protein